VALRSLGVCRRIVGAMGRLLRSGPVVGRAGSCPARFLMCWYSERKYCEDCHAERGKEQPELLPTRQSHPAELLQPKIDFSLVLWGEKKNMTPPPAHSFVRCPNNKH